MKKYKNSFRNALMALLGGAMLCVACKKDDGPNTSCEILSFSVNGDEWNISGTNITCAYPTEITETSLMPTITLSPGATVNPPAGEAQNFFTEQGVSYTVTAEDGVTAKIYTAKANVQITGITGDCTWTLTGVPENYTLTVSGNGAMEDYYGSRNDAPWYQYRYDIKNVDIQDGVTTIGDWAFYECDYLAKITIGNSVTAIGAEAFQSCNSLTTVTTPNSVTTIGNRAFYQCRGLTTVTIGNSVTAIGDGAFDYCGGLISINVDAANAQYSSENGVLFDDRDKTILLRCPEGKTGSYVIPNSVTAIGVMAFFGCARLTSVTIPNSVTTIGGSAFSGCSGLTSLTIPNSVRYIGSYVFSDCSNLISFNVDASNAQYSSEDGIMFNKDKTTLVSYPAGKTGGYVIPNSITTIGMNAFQGCGGLTSVTIPNSVTTIENYAFSNCRGLISVTISNSVTTIGFDAFFGCVHLTSVTIGNSVTTIGIHAFGVCSSLTSVTIGNSVTTIGDNAFDYCRSLTSVTNLNPVPQNIYNSVFSDVNIGVLTLKVPASAVDAYKAAPVWSEFGNIVAITD